MRWTDSGPSPMTPLPPPSRGATQTFLPSKLLALSLEIGLTYLGKKLIIVPAYSWPMTHLGTGLMSPPTPQPAASQWGQEKAATLLLPWQGPCGCRGGDTWFTAPWSWDSILQVHFSISRAAILRTNSHKYLIDVVSSMRRKSVALGSTGPQYYT